MTAKKANQGAAKARNARTAAERAIEKAAYKGFIPAKAAFDAAEKALKAAATAAKPLEAAADKAEHAADEAFEAAREADAAVFEALHAEVDARLDALAPSPADKAAIDDDVAEREARRAIEAEKKAADADKAYEAAKKVADAARKAAAPLEAATRKAGAKAFAAFIRYYAAACEDQPEAMKRARILGQRGERARLRGRSR